MPLTLNLPSSRRRQGALLACLLTLAGCGGQPVRPTAAPPAPPIAVAAPARAVVPTARRAPRIDVVDGNVWTSALAAVAQSLQQAALSDGAIEVMRMPDNRLRLRIEVAAALDRPGEAPLPRFRRFTEDMAGLLVRQPSVQVEVIGRGATNQPAALRQGLAWGLSVERVLRAHGVAPGRLAARAAGPAEAEAPWAQPAGRCIDVLLSDPLTR
ncbi:MAG TPA: hypothetical protein VIN58_05565 [Roseateles sp.]